MTDPATVAFDAIAQGRLILVLAPHPDDESLGCGGLLAKAFAGPGAHVVCMTDGAASHPGSRAYPPVRLAGLRAAELDRALIELGGSRADVTRLGLPDAGLGDLAPEYGRIAERVARIAVQRGAGCLLASAGTDPHCDHVATAAIGARAARRAGIRCLFYPIWSRWALPDTRSAAGATREYRLATAAFRDRKQRAVAAHASQMGQVIDDDPDGFVCPADFVSLFLDNDEIFFECGAP